MHHFKAAFTMHRLIVIVWWPLQHILATSSKMVGDRENMFWGLSSYAQITFLCHSCSAVIHDEACGIGNLCVPDQLALQNNRSTKLPTTNQNLVSFLLLDEASRAVLVIVTVTDGRKRFWRQLNNSKTVIVS